MRTCFALMCLMLFGAACKQDLTLEVRWQDPEVDRVLVALGGEQECVVDEFSCSLKIRYEKRFDGQTLFVNAFVGDTLRYRELRNPSFEKSLITVVLGEALDVADAGVVDVRAPDANGLDVVNAPDANGLDVINAPDANGLDVVNAPDANGLDVVNAPDANGLDVVNAPDANGLDVVNAPDVIACVEPEFNQVSCASQEGCYSCLDNGVCVPKCPGSTCSNASVICPDDIPCQFQCLPQLCSATTFVCADDSPCEIDCSQGGTCINAEVICKNGPCHVNCGPSSCTNLTLRCASGECGATCALAPLGFEVEANDSCLVEVATCQ